jgi:ubiquinone/menaquinone biosynthesis C-methylase UbiE
MTVLVLEGSLLRDALARAGDEDVVLIDHSAAELERFERETADPRVFYLIGDPEILPLPDRSVDRALGADGAPELARVLRP